MSERGSFVTEYIYCKECLKVIEDAFLPIKEKHFYAYRLDSCPIIAGRLGALGSGGEFEVIQNVQELVRDKLCHSVRMSILCDDLINDRCFDLKNDEII